MKKFLSVLSLFALVVPASTIMGRVVGAPGAPRARGRAVAPGARRRGAAPGARRRAAAQEQELEENVGTLAMAEEASKTMGYPELYDVEEAESVVEEVAGSEAEPEELLESVGISEEEVEEGIEEPTKAELEEALSDLASVAQESDVAASEVASHAEEAEMALKEDAPKDEVKKHLRQVKENLRKLSPQKRRKLFKKLVRHPRVRRKLAAHARKRGLGRKLMARKHHGGAARKQHCPGGQCPRR